MGVCACACVCVRINRMVTFDYVMDHWIVGHKSVSIGTKQFLNPPLTWPHHLERPGLPCINSGVGDPIQWEQNCSLGWNTCKDLPFLWIDMPMFLISTLLFWQVLFCAVIWTWEKQRKNWWCVTCFSRKVVMAEGPGTQQAPEKPQNLLPVGRGGCIGDTESTLL